MVFTVIRMAGCFAGSTRLPPRRYDSVRVSLAHVHRVRAVAMVDADTFRHADEPEDRVTGLRIAALGQGIIDVLDVDIHLQRQCRAVGVRYELALRTDGHADIIQVGIQLLDTLHVLLARSQSLLEVRDGFVAQFEHEFGYVCLVVVDLPVLQPSFEQFASFGSLLVLYLLECLTDLILRLG